VPLSSVSLNQLYRQLTAILTHPLRFCGYQSRVELTQFRLVLFVVGQHDKSVDFPSSILNTVLLKVSFGCV